MAPSNMDWKYVKLHCPNCGFAHDFKRETWWTLPDGTYIGLYETADGRSRKDCEQELIFGESTYDKLTPFLNSKAPILLLKKETPNGRQ